MTLVASAFVFFVMCTVYPFHPLLVGAYVVYLFENIGRGLYIPHSFNKIIIVVSSEGLDYEFNTWDLPGSLLVRAPDS